MSINVKQTEKHKGRLV